MSESAQPIRILKNTDKVRAALSLPLAETLQRLDGLQQSHNTGQRQSETAIRDIADTLRLLPQMGSQISGLTQRIDDFVIGIESHTHSQAQKEETKSACQFKGCCILQLALI